MIGLWEEEEEGEKTKTWKDWVVDYAWLIVTAVFFFVMRGRLGTTVFDTATYYTFIFIVFILFAKSAYIVWENKTAKIVFNPGHDTTDGSFDVVGNFAIIRPAVKAFGLYWKKNGAYVAPLDAIHKEGRNIVITCKMDFSRLEEMPLEVRSYIVEQNIKPPYYIGFADEEQYYQFLDDPDKESGLEKPSVGYLIDEIKKTNKQVMLRENILKGDMSMIESFVSGASRITTTARGGLFDAIKRALIEERRE